MAKPNRNRVLGERLWDAQGQVWMRELGRWASEQRVEQLLAEGRPMVTFGLGRPMVWVPPRQAPAAWAGIRGHFQIPGLHGAAADAEGLTYAAVIWRRDSELLLGMQIFC